MRPAGRAKKGRKMTIRANWLQSERLPKVCAVISIVRAKAKTV
jgi:hypothetical protein